MNNLDLQTLIPADVRNQILSNGEALVDALNNALKGKGVEFVRGKSLSAMVKASKQYQALAGTKGAQTKFMNEVRSILKAHKVGEQMTLEVIAKGFWAQFNGTNADKADAEGNPGAVKKVNISFVRPGVEASKEDAKIENRIKEARNNAALEYLQKVHGVTDDELAKAIAAVGNVVTE